MNLAKVWRRQIRKVSLLGVTFRQALLEMRRIVFYISYLVTNTIHFFIDHDTTQYYTTIDIQIQIVTVSRWYNNISL